MSGKFEGKIKEIVIDGNCIYFKIEYMDEEEKLIVKTIPYSRKFNRYTYKVYDKVEFELIKDNKAKIIDDNLFEIDTSINLFEIAIFLIVILCLFAWKLTNNMIFLNLFAIFIVMIIVAVCIRAYNLVRRGTIVKGKIVSKKTSFSPGSGSNIDNLYEKFDFGILYNDKVYYIRKNPISVAEKMDIGDEVEIAIYKNTVVWAEEFIKAKGGVKVNYKALPVFVLVISLFVYIIIFGDRFGNEQILLIAVVVIIIMIFICASIATDKKKIKKKKKKKNH